LKNASVFLFSLGNNAIFAVFFGRLTLFSRFTANSLLRQKLLHSIYYLGKLGKMGYLFA
jgi:hypothetical protein